MDGGSASTEEMVASIERGLLVTRFWYIRHVDPMIPLLTGMTRDGLFLIEQGKVARPVQHMRFNENMVDMLNRVEMLGPVARTGEFPMLVPALKVLNFNFTSTTKF
jgi:predicted Zn-dependent protease